MKLLGTMVLLIGLGTVAFAQEEEVAAVPEISSASAVSALAMISGAVLVFRGRRKK